MNYELNKKQLDTILSALRFSYLTEKRELYEAEEVDKQFLKKNLDDLRDAIEALGASV